MNASGSERSDVKTTIVTGASGALGGAVVADLLEGGFRVVAFDRHQPEAARPGEGVSHLMVDLLDEVGVREAVGTAVSQSGGIAALVCLAGGFFGDTPVVDTDPQRLREQFELNVVTVYNCVHAVLPHMLAAGGGAIVGVASRPAVQPVEGAVAYGIAKLGVVKLMEQVATEYRGRGIRANAIVPSIIDTSANRRSMPDADFERWVRPEQIAAVIRFLVGEDAAIISGAAIPVYGRA